jgi:hypothetical protein
MTVQDARKPITNEIAVPSRSVQGWSEARDGSTRAREAEVPANEAAMKRRFEDRLRALEPVLKSTFDQLNTDYRVAAEADSIASEQDRTFNRRGCQHRQADLYERQMGRREDRLRRLEPQAAFILRAFDDALAELVVLLHGGTKNARVGPTVGDGVYVADVLQAVGNYLRHHQEWRNVWLECRAFDHRQRASIDPLVRTVVPHGGSMSHEDAYDAFLALPRPLLTVLDVLTNYEDAAGCGSYESLLEAIVGTGHALVEIHWPSFHIRRAALLRRHQAFADIARKRREFATIAFSDFFKTVGAEMRNHLPEGVDVRYDPEQGWWSNGTTFAALMHNQNFCVTICWGEMHELNDEFGLDGPYNHWESYPLEPDSIPEVADLLADWLACDRLDTDGYPVAPETFVPSYLRYAADAKRAEMLQTL